MNDFLLRFTFLEDERFAGRSEKVGRLAEVFELVLVVDLGLSGGKSEVDSLMFLFVSS